MPLMVERGCDRRPRRRSAPDPAARRALICPDDGSASRPCHRSWRDTRCDGAGCLPHNTWSAAPDLYLEDLYVDASARGIGVGAALISAVADRAADLGARKVTWETDAANDTAQRLYDRLAPRSTEVHYTLDPNGVASPR